MDDWTYTLGAVHEGRSCAMRRFANTCGWAYWSAVATARAGGCFGQTRPLRPAGSLRKEGKRNPARSEVSLRCIGKTRQPKSWT
jgi:hypothetical protein